MRLRPLKILFYIYLRSFVELIILAKVFTSIAKHLKSRDYQAKKRQKCQPAIPKIEKRAFKQDS